MSGEFSTAPPQTELPIQQLSQLGQYELRQTETVRVPDITTTERPESRAFELGDGSVLNGASAMTLRLGGETTYVDAQIIDVRNQPYAVEGLTSDGRQLQPMRKVGTGKDGRDVNAAGDFILLIPSADGQTRAETRILTVGQPLTIGSESQVGNRSQRPGLLPDTVSRDHCEVNLGEDGALTVVNHDPTNSTILLPPVETPVVTEAMATPERRQISEDEAVNLLSYSDILRVDGLANSDNPELQQALAWTRESANGMKYAHELQSMVEREGLDGVTGLAEQLRAQCSEGLQKLGVEPSKYSDSVSWAVWDLAKQSYLSKHPEETTEEYRTASRSGDPLAEGIEGHRKQREIVHRHIGWEVSRALDSGELSVDKLNVHGDHRASISQVLEAGDRNETGQLRSFVLAQLGRRALVGAGLTLDPTEGLSYVSGTADA